MSHSKLTEPTYLGLPVSGLLHLPEVHRPCSKRYDPEDKGPCYKRLNPEDHKAFRAKRRAFGKLKGISSANTLESFVMNPNPTKNEALRIGTRVKTQTNIFTFDEKNKYLPTFGVRESRINFDQPEDAGSDTDDDPDKHNWMGGEGFEGTLTGPELAEVVLWRLANERGPCASYVTFGRVSHLLSWSNKLEVLQRGFRPLGDEEALDATDAFFFDWNTVAVTEEDLARLLLEIGKSNPIDLTVFMNDEMNWSQVIEFTMEWWAKVQSVGHEMKISAMVPHLKKAIFTLYSKQ
jgi:hypothetical protein